MKNNELSKELEYKGKKYLLIFNINVMEKIQDEYGTIKDWAKLVEGKDKEPNAKAIKFCVMHMINEGIDISNESKKEEEKEKFFSLNEVGRLLTEVGINNVQEKMYKAISNSVTPSENEKN